MQNSCAFPATSKCLLCKLPPCSCQKCSQLRSEGKPDRDEVMRCFKSSNDTIPKNADANSSNEATTNGPMKLDKGKLLGLQSLHLPTFNFTPSNLQSFLFDIVGIISFFIMATIMFWVTISQYLWHFAQMIIQWGRRAQLTTLVLLLLLSLSITFHAIKGAHHRQHKRQPISKPSDPASPHNGTSNNNQPSKCLHYKSCPRKRCSHCNLQNSSKNSKGCDLISSENHSNIKTNNKQCDKCAGHISSSSDNLAKKQNPSLCDLCTKHMRYEAQPILSDDEAREMYKTFRLYAIPTEMKTPPSISNLLEFLSGLYNSITGSTANSES